MKNILLGVSLCFLMACSMNKDRVETEHIFLVKAGDKVAAVNLTVAEGKRLIALGIANHPLVQEKILL